MQWVWTGLVSPRLWSYAGSACRSRSQCLPTPTSTRCGCWALFPRSSPTCRPLRRPHTMPGGWWMATCRWWSWVSGSLQKCVCFRDGKKMAGISLDPSLWHPHQALVIDHHPVYDCLYHGVPSNNIQIIGSDTWDEICMSTFVFPTSRLSIIWVASSAFGFLKAKSGLILSA